MVISPMSINVNQSRQHYKLISCALYMKLLMNAFMITFIMKIACVKTNCIYIMQKMLACLLCLLAFSLTFTSNQNHPIPSPAPFACAIRLHYSATYISIEMPFGPLDPAIDERHLSGRFRKIKY